MRRGSDLEKRSEFKEKTLDLRRVTRVVAGGKRFKFRATVVLGDEKGRVGVGLGKGSDVAQSIDKAKIDAKKALMNVPLSDTTIPHETEAKFGAARVIIKPAPKGHGLKAGGSVRTVLLMAGVRDAVAKCVGKTKNKLSNAQATIAALKKLKTSKQ